MGEKSTQIEREELRRLTLAYLAQRQTLEFRVEAITRGLNREHGGTWTDEDTEGALAFLAGAGWVAAVERALVRTRSWQATTGGVVAHEKGALA